MAGGRRALTEETYQRALKVYRECPGNFTEAARRIPCDRRLAKRLWQGPPYEVYPWAVPIQLVFEDERKELLRIREEHVRAAADADHAAKEAARKAREEAIAAEQRIMQVARGDVLSALALAAELAPAMRILAKVIITACQPQPDGSPPAIAPASAMALLTRHTQMIQRAVGSAETIVQLGRLERGQSTANVGLGAFSSEMSVEDALAELEGLERFIEEQRTAALPPRAGVPERGASPLLVNTTGASLPAGERH